MTGRRGARDADAGIDLSATAGTLHVPSQTSGGRISMAARLSNPIESLINDRPPKEIFAEVDVAIVGSGYGGRIAAPPRSRPPPRGGILQRARAYLLCGFPAALGAQRPPLPFPRADRR